MEQELRILKKDLELKHREEMCIEKVRQLNIIIKTTAFKNPKNDKYKHFYIYFGRFFDKGMYYDDYRDC